LPGFQDTDTLAQTCHFSEGPPRRRLLVDLILLAAVLLVRADEARGTLERPDDKEFARP
jgi:hypothetical protein